MMPAERIDGVPLAQLLPASAVTGELPGAAVAGLALDSRRVIPGGVFIALPGTSGHGLDYLDDALARAPLAVLFDAADARWTDEAAARCCAAGAAAVAVTDLRGQLGPVAAAFHGWPSRALERIVAVTGTDGKTSVSHFVAAMLDDGDAPAAVLGTLGHGRPGHLRDTGLTTPDAIGVQAALADLVAGGAHRVALEASSHGLAQRRLEATRIDVAVLTHLGRDHLDYHGSEAAYADAKARLFAWPGLGAAVINADDAFGQRLLGELDPGVQALTYGAAGRLRAEGVTPEADGLALTLVLDEQRERVRVPLVGRFNVANLLAACGALLALGHGLQDVASRVARVRPVPGRMELFRAPGRPAVVVDYAHNAGALAAALGALREHAAGRVWCVFGAGGDRDPGKRPLMGAAAASGADRVVVTDDNPRGEDPDRIVADILAGMPDGSTAEVEHDRGRALAMAVEQAGPDDIVLLAGKGHERVQIRGERELAWDDREAAEAVLVPASREGP